MMIMAVIISKWNLIGIHTFLCTNSFHFYPLHNHDSLNVSRRGKAPLTHVIPTLLGHKGIRTSSVSHGISHASCTAAPAPAPGLLSRTLQSSLRLGSQARTKTLVNETSRVPCKGHAASSYVGVA